MVEKIDINVDKLKEYEKELVKYDGYLPSIIRWAISIDYTRNIMKSDKFTEVMEQVNKTRKYTYEEYNKEMMDWCKNNPKYSDILNK